MSERVRALRVVGPESALTEALASSLSGVEGFAVERVRPWDVTDTIEGVDAVVVVDDVPASDAVETYNEIRSTESNVPVIAVGNDPEPGRIEAVLSAGVTEYVAWDRASAAELGARVRAHVRNPMLDGAAEARRWRTTIGSLAHDMKNPLNVVAGRLELLDIEDPHGEAIDRSIGRVESLLDEVSRVASATDHGTVESVDLAAVTDHVWSALDTTAATLTVKADGTVECDREALRLVLRRLLENAVVHGGEGVTVTVGDAPGGFYVADDGPGIPADDRERVFEQGYGTEPHGEGYGLFVADRVARANGWSLTVSESRDGGARFDVQDR